MKYRITILLIVVCCGCAEDSSSGSADIGANAAQGDQVRTDEPAATESDPAKAASEANEAANESEATPAVRQTAEVTNSLGMQFVKIPAGTFLMGSPRNEPGRWPDEPRHRVQISRPFYLSVHEVTIDQFRRFVSARGIRLSRKRTIRVDTATK